MSHQVIDQVSLELARAVAQRLQAQPELLAVARENLARWSRQNAQAPGLLRCYAQWQAILERPLPEICTVLVAPTEEGQRLRQNSPFAGLLSAAEVWAIKKRYRPDATRAA